jgi:hypothetical protein
VWRCAPRAKRSFARGWLGQLFWWATGATKAVGPCHWALIVLSVFLVCEFVCVLFFYERKWVFPGF